MPTPQIVVDAMLKLGGIRKDDFLIDLGSGDGRIVITAAKQFGARGFGVDHDPRLVDFANKHARDEGVADRAKFIRQDLFETDLRSASILSMYLLPDVNLELRPRIWEQLKPGTRIVSHDYDLGDWRPDDKITMPVPNKPVGPLQQSTIFLFIVPAKVGGAWRGDLSTVNKKHAISLDIGQKFQDIEVGAAIDGTRTPVSNATIAADRVSFSLEVNGKPQTFAGTVAGDRIAGEFRGADGSRLPWRATRVRPAS